MKRYIYLMVMAMITSIAISCSSGKMTPKQKHDREVADSVAHMRSAQLLTSRSFLIKSKTIRTAYMGTKEVIPEHNFLMMNADRAMVSFSPLFSGMANGVGGSTYEGNMENFKETIKDNGEIYITFKIAKGIKKANVTITLPPKSAQAMISVNNYATMYGIPQPYDPSVVVDGMH